VVEKGYDAVVKPLLEKGADLESKEDSGQTPLLDTGRFDVDSKDKEGRAPLS
jgi:ankyrin repeat protein